MNRRTFIKRTGLTVLGFGASVPAVFPLHRTYNNPKSEKEMISDLHNLKEQGSRLPALFVGHGSPMNAIEMNEFSSEWKQVGARLPKPSAILCISAHWETKGTRVCTVSNPKTIHDFYGFPRELYDVNYPAPGSPEFARMTTEEVKKTHIESDIEWGLDHGCWSVLLRMFPLADVPVYQLSLDYSQPPRYHYELAGELASLRKKGVLIVGSGNIVHNLRLMRMGNEAFEWATGFDEKVRSLILDGNHDALVDYQKMGTMANLSVPTNEHYLPLLYTLGVAGKDEPVQFFNDKTVMGSVSMRSLIVG